MLNKRNPQSFAARLKAIRSACGLTQDILSQAAGIDRSSLSYYELGQMFPSLNKLCLMASLFGITLDELLGPAEDPAVLLLNDDSSELEELAEIYQKSPDFDLSPSIAKLTTEEQLLILYYRQLLENDRHKFLYNISEAAEEMQKQLLDPNDEDFVILPPDQL